MTQIPPDMPWQAPAPIGPDRVRRSTVFLWILGAMQSLFFGCFGSLYGIMAVMPLDELQKIQNMPPDAVAQLQQVYPWLGPIAIGMFSLGFIPGIAYVVLGFFVKRQHRGATLTATTLVLAQTLVLGLVTMLSIAGAVMQGNPFMLTVILILFGTPLLVEGFTIYNLLAALKHKPSDPLEVQQDPWR